MNDAARRALFESWFSGPPLKGDREALIRRTGYTKGRISQFFDPEQPFGERAARSLAERLGFPKEFFNTPPAPAHGSAPPTAAEAGTPSAASADPGRALRELAQFFAHTPQSTRDTVATLTASAIKDPATLPDCLRALDALAQYSAASIETSAISKAKA